MRVLLVGFLCVLGLMPFGALAQGGESIASFDVQAMVEPDRMVTVTETITYDFGSAERHGIFREIPVRYERNGATYRLRLDVGEVLMDGAAVPWEITDRSPLTLKIGDPDVTITGQHVYQISYRTDRALNFVEGAAELYWNVTGNGWEVPIREAAMRIEGPDGFIAANAETVCFVGVYGSTEESCDVETAGSRVSLTAHRVLQSGEGMTVAVRFPAGMIAEPTTQERVQQFVADNWTIAIPFVVLAGMLWLWFTRGREPKGRGTVVPQYAPPRGMTPAEMVSLRDQQVPTQVVTATLLDLARRGYFKIVFGEAKRLFKKEQTYTFVKQKEADANVNEAEKQLLDGLFRDGAEVTLEDLKGTFYKEVALFKKAVMKQLQAQKLFTAHPGRVRGLYMGAAFAIVLVSFWFLAVLATPLTFVMMLVSAIVVGVLGYFMPQKTKEGAVVLEEVQGFKWFLSVTEKDRLKFHNAPALKPAQFHQFLPAAVAFGVEEAWAKQFQGLDIPPPDYATGMPQWNAFLFASAMQDLNRSATQAAYTAPSSAGAGGSGFSGGGSGGGFGGGGGGSW